MLNLPARVRDKYHSPDNRDIAMCVIRRRRRGVVIEILLSSRTQEDPRLREKISCARIPPENPGQRVQYVRVFRTWCASLASNSGESRTRKRARACNINNTARYGQNDRR